MVVIMPTVTPQTRSNSSYYPPSILGRMLITELPFPPNNHLFDFSLGILNFLTVTYIYIYDFTDRGEFSNWRLYGEILEPLVIESGNEKPVALDVSIYLLFQISS